MEDNKSKIGWGVLGFFIPVVGLILFLAWIGKDKKASTAAGIGALIGFVVSIIVTVVGFLFFGFGTLFGLEQIDSKGNIIIDKKEEVGIKVNMIEYKEEINNNYDIEEYHYEANWVDQFYDFYDLDEKIVSILDDDNEVLFKIQALEKGSDDFNFYIILNNGKQVQIQDKLLTLVGVFDFYYVDDLLIFNVGYDNDEYYYYDYKQDKIVNAFSKDDTNNKGMTVSNIKFNENDDLIFETYVNVLDKDNLESGKSGIVTNLETNYYGTIADLDEALSSNNLEDFVLKQVYTYKKTTKGYSVEPSLVEETTIREAFTNN